VEQIVQKAETHYPDVTSRELMGGQKDVVQSFPIILYIANFVRDSHTTITSRDVT
jgi:hypothetical protein